MWIARASGPAKKARSSAPSSSGRPLASPTGVVQPSPYPAAPPSLVLPEGQIWIGERLGRGPCSTVYVAWLERHGRLLKRVAVKVLHGPEDTYDSMAAHVQRVARATALVSHPNVVGVLEAGQLPSGEPFIVAEVVDGMSLHRLLAAYRAAGRRMPLDLALFIGAEIAEGLAGARATKSPEGRLIELSHLDLSPRSALLSYNGEVKVEGFSLAMPLVGGSGIRSVRGLGQRVAAMAPEVARGKPGDARSDVFSLGIVLYEMLVGPRFPQGTNDTDACVLARDGEVGAGSLGPSLPDDVTSIVRRCVSLEPADRQAHAGVVAYDLRQIALKMGVGDGRVFLRTSLFEMSEGLHVSHEDSR